MIFFTISIIKVHYNLIILFLVLSKTFLSYILKKLVGFETSFYQQFIHRQYPGSFYLWNDSLKY
jgi:hypothetical protein